MSKYFIFVCLLGALTLKAKSQDSLSNKIVGKWEICYSLDTLEKACARPFNSYIFNSNGTCQNGDVIIMGEKIPVKGYWKIENGSIKITYDKHPNFSYPSQTLPDITFLTNELFYYKVMSTDEAPGRWIFFSLRKTE